MKFTETLVMKLSDKHLLKHEFYQAWSAGTISLETLRLYAQQYYQHVKAFPRYISATHSNCDDIRARQVLLENLNEEEGGSNHHPELWMRFAEGLGAPRATLTHPELLPETCELVNTFLTSSRRSYAEGLGVLFAYEHQIPEIATFKIDALKKHYCIEDPSTLEFFEVHRQADVYHTQALSNLLEELSTTEKLQTEKAAQIAANQLWRFLDGIHRTQSI